MKLTHPLKSHSLALDNSLHLKNKAGLHLTALTIACMSFGFTAPSFAFDSVLELSSLNGSNGFRVDGLLSDDFAGYSVSSAGDFNGDGFDDIIVGAVNAELNDDNTGAAYIVFGSPDGFDSFINVSSLNGENGFRLDGVADDDETGESVSYAGDINGDGLGDIIIGAVGGGPSDPNNSRDSTGVAYVVFGSRSAFSPSINLSDLNGSNGFILIGSDFGDNTGESVSSAGDLNDDGFDDVIIGAQAANNGVGSAYVVFGSGDDFSPTIELTELDGNNGFRLNGRSEFEIFGTSVNSVGDVNSDGISDIIVGGGSSDIFTGSAHIIYGDSSGFNSVINVSGLNGVNGFRIDGTLGGGVGSGGFGDAVSPAGDINNDGIDDILIAARDSEFNGTRSGSSYVVFGQESEFPAVVSIENLDGSNGFRLDGEPGDRSAYSLNQTGDINGDGFDDLAIGAPYNSLNGTNSGSTYILFGRDSSFNPVINLSKITDDTGFRIDGSSSSGFAGYSVSPAGDINGDGVQDLVIGAPLADFNDEDSSGSAYVVFGVQSDDAAELCIPITSQNGNISVVCL